MPGQGGDVDGGVVIAEGDGGGVAVGVVGGGADEFGACEGDAVGGEVAGGVVGAGFEFAGDRPSDGSVHPQDGVVGVDAGGVAVFAFDGHRCLACAEAQDSGIEVGEAPGGDALRDAPHARGPVPLVGPPEDIPGGIDALGDVVADGVFDGHGAIFERLVTFGRMPDNPPGVVCARAILDPPRWIGRAHGGQAAGVVLEVESLAVAVRDAHELVVGPGQRDACAGRMLDAVEPPVGVEGISQATGQAQPPSVGQAVEPPAVAFAEGVETFQRGPAAGHVFTA